jgi:hypothetical protein
MAELAVHRGNPGLEQDPIILIRSRSANVLFERVIHVSGDSASDDHALDRGSVPHQRGDRASPVRLGGG